MRILQIIAQHKLRSGGAIQMQRLACILSKMGHEVYAIFGYHPEFQDDFKIFSSSNVNIDFLNIDESFKIDRKTMKAVKKVRSLLKEKKFDIIHTHKGCATDLIFTASIGLDVNIIANRGMSCPLDFWNSIKYRSNKIKKIIAVSEQVKNVMAETGKISRDKIEVVYGGVDTDEFSPHIRSTLRSELAISNNIKIIGYAGSSLERKGLQYLFDAFEIFMKNYKNYILVLAGVTTEDLKKFKLDPVISNYIYPIGFRKDVNNCMAGFDLFVFPGIMDEGLTGTVREAASSGLPIISTDIGGNKEIVCENRGLLVPPRDSQKLVQAMELLCGNSETASTYGKNARKFVLKNMSDEIRYGRILRVYSCILEVASLKKDTGERESTLLR